MYKCIHTQSTCKHGTSKEPALARARTVPLKPKIRPLQTWAGQQSASLEAGPAHGFGAARGPKGADGSGWVPCQESLRAAWPSSNPPATEERGGGGGGGGGGRGNLKREVLKPPTRSYSHKRNLPSAFPNCLKNESTRGGIPR